MTLIKPHTHELKKQVFAAGVPQDYSTGRSALSRLRNLLSRCSHFKSLEINAHPQAPIFEHIMPTGLV